MLKTSNNDTLETNIEPTSKNIINIISNFVCPHFYVYVESNQIYLHNFGVTKNFGIDTHENRVLALKKAETEFDKIVVDTGLGQPWESSYKVIEDWDSSGVFAVFIQFNQVWLRINDGNDYYDTNTVFDSDGNEVFDQYGINAVYECYGNDTPENRESALEAGKQEYYDYLKRHERRNFSYNYDRDKWTEEDLDDYMKEHYSHLCD